MSASEQDPTLPAAVRLQLVTIAADVLGRTPVAELPPAVRRFARFAPARRVRMGAAEIAAALSVDAGFRDRIADIVTEASPELAARVGAGEVPSAADPVDVAVLAYLLRPPNWHELLTAVSHELVQAEAGSNAELERARAEIERLTRTNAELTRLREAARAAARSTAAEHAAAVAALQGRLRSAHAELRTAQRTVEARERELAERAATADRTRASELAELRKARARIQELEAAAETGRRGARAEREHDEARLWVLLEAITGAAAGLRRELDLTPARRRPTR